MRVVVVSHQKYPSHGGWKRKKKLKKKKKEVYASTVGAEEN